MPEYLLDAPGNEKMDRARALEAEAARLSREAARLRQEVFKERKLPDQWRIGQTVRMLRDSAWAWNRGAIMVISKLLPEYTGRPAREYQVFYTSHLNGFGCFWTTPDDVELIDESQL